MKKQSDLLEMVELWKKNNITECQMEFSCGGDSMNDYSFTFHTREGSITNEDTNTLNDYFDNEVFNNVEFYEVSDGHYMGETGTVQITLDDDEESFSYYKDAQSEWEELESETTEVELSDKEVEFLKTYVSNINGGDGNVVTIYKKDLILDEEQQELIEKLEKRLDEIALEHEFTCDGEWSEWYSFTTDIGNEDLSIEGNTLTFTVEKRFYIYKPSYD